MTDAIHILAGEYVVGTLDSLEREQVRASRISDAALDAEIRWWEERLAPLLDGIEPVMPPPHLWTAIEARTRQHAFIPAGMDDARLWQRVAAAACAIALFSGTVGMYSVLRPPPSLQAIALLQSENAAPAFAVSLQGEKLVVVAAAAPANHSYELWIIAGQQPPESLGVLTATRTVLPLPMPRDQLHAVTFAVSLEPGGGSPTGLPTGPVVSTGKLVAL